MARGKEASTRELVITDRGACFVQTAFVGASRSAWQHVAVFLGLKFLGFVVLRPYKTPVVSVF